MMDERRKLQVRIIDRNYVHETDCSLLPAIGPLVAKKVCMNGQISTRQFVKLTDEQVVRPEDFDSPKWADIVTGTLYNMDGKSASGKVFMVRRK